MVTFGQLDGNIEVISKTLVLIDIQSDFSVFRNPDILHKIYPITNHMKVFKNVSTQTSNLIEETYRF